MARKSKSSSEASPAFDTPRQDGVKKDTPKSSKRKIDWSTIDDNGPFQGFALRYRKPTKKQKTTVTPPQDGKESKNAPMGPDIIQPNIFEGAELSETHWHVYPEAEWEGTNRYRKFTIEKEEFEVGDTVFIKADASQDPGKGAPVQGWVAKVLEVRAGDPNHVYLRVFWLYRPEDLPTGRQKYHGYNELIASNDMAIIDAMTVDGGAKVVHWQEQKDQAELLMPNQLFWRQTLDITKNPPDLSDLPKHCVDFTPCNPDELLIQCESCDTWLHGSCLEEDALREAYMQHGLPYPDDTTSTKPKGGKKKRTSKGPAAFSAQIVTTQSGKTRLTVTDNRPEAKGDKSWDVPVKCLSCPAIIEKVEKVDAQRIRGDSEATNTTPQPDNTVLASLVQTEKKPPHTPANQGDDEVDSVVGNDISSPIIERAADAPSNPLEAPAAKTNGYSQDPSKKRKRRATDGSNNASTGKKKRRSLGPTSNTSTEKTHSALGETTDSSMEKKHESPDGLKTPPPDKSADQSVLQSGLQSSVKTLKRMFWKP